MKEDPEDAAELPRAGGLSAKRTKNKSKKLKRKENYWRRSVLEDDQYNYLVTILETMGQQQDDEERQLMANNVLGQMEGMEIKTSSNQLGSRVLENLIAYADEEMFAKQMDTFTENLRVVCCDSFASHVLQRMLSVALLRAVAPQQPEPEEAKDTTQPPKKPRAFNRGNNDQTLWATDEYCLREPYSDEHRKKCMEFIRRAAKYLINNLEEFIWDGVAHYVVRHCLLNLCGIVSRKEKESKDPRRLTVPEELLKLVHEFSLCLMSWPTFSDLPETEMTSSVLQDLIYALATSGEEFQLRQLVKKLTKESFIQKKAALEGEEDDDAEDEKVNRAKDGPRGSAETSLPRVFQRVGTVRVLESCIISSPASLLKDKIFSKLFRGHLEKLAMARSSNFALQKLIDHTKDKDMMDLIFGELEGSVENILRVGHTGVVLSMAKACARLSCQQGKFVKVLLDALHCGEVAPAKLISAVLCLLPVDVTPPVEPAINLHGSLILQAILEFNKPIKFVTALLEMPADRLAQILKDPRGSFLANAFVGSRFVGEKSREKLVRRLEGQYSQLALSSPGSRVVELMYEAGNPAQRENIVRELAEDCPQLSNTPFGIFINKRLLVDTYRRDPARWKVAIKHSTKVEKMFDKIVPGSKRKAES